MIDISELVKRVIKYLVEGLMVAIAAYAIPKRSLNMEEIILLALRTHRLFEDVQCHLICIPSLLLTLPKALEF